MSQATMVAPPVKGLRWQHAKRVYSTYGASAGQPLILEVTAIRTVNGRETVYSKPISAYSGRPEGDSIKTPLSAWEKWCAAVVAAPPEKETYPPISKREAAALLKRAHEAGMAAGEAAVPEVMIVGSPTTPLGSDIDPAKPVYAVMDGVCGFAYINIPGDTPLGRYVAKQGWRRAYYGGMERGVGAFGQSLTRKEAYASAFVSVLREAGHKASSNSRMD
jgi:hypothetical protein